MSQRDLLDPSPASSAPHLPTGARHPYTFTSPYSPSSRAVPNYSHPSPSPSLSTPPHPAYAAYHSPPTPLANLGASKETFGHSASPSSSDAQHTFEGSTAGLAAAGAGGGWKGANEAAYGYAGYGAYGPHAGDSQSMRQFFDSTRSGPSPSASRNGKAAAAWYKRPWPLALLFLGVAAVAAAAIGLGIHFGRQASPGKASGANGNAPSVGSGGNGSASPGGTNGTNSSAPAAPAYNVTGIAPLPKWNWTDRSTPMVGISLGNWLVLERWMAEDWFVASSAPDAYDEWTFSNITGSNASTAARLQQHWDSWVTEDDVERVFQAGINMIRVPTGYWAWVDTIEGEPYVQAGQLDRLERVMAWAYKRGMYVLVDLHGLPGSQNGEQQSGHNTSDVRFYQPAYQNRSDATLATALEWISASPYRSVVSGIEVCNEPRPNADDNFAVLRAYYERAYTACTARADPVPMVFHHGFPSTDHLAYWLDFVSGKDPDFLVLEDHPYPGNFPLQTDSANILYQVCQDAASYEGYPVPVAVTEWSLTTGVPDLSFEQQFYQQQLTAWAWSAGSIFWSLRANLSSNPILAAAPAQQVQYSFLDLLDQGAIATPAQGANTSSAAFVQSLQQGCGGAPGEQWGNWTFASVSAAPTYTSGSLTTYPTSTAAA